LKIVLGVVLATAGDYYFTLPGLLLTLLGTLLAATKTLLTNTLQTHLLSQPLHPIDLLLRMSPLACLQSLAYAHLHGELDVLTARLSTRAVVRVLGNGGLAFLLNVVSFTTNRMTGALTMTVAANLKQCLSVVVGIWVFRVEVGVVNGVGILVALVGGMWYARIEVAEKTKKKELEELGSLRLDEKEIV
jgi:hypothetical protein